MWKNIVKIGKSTQAQFLFQPYFHSKDSARLKKKKAADKQVDLSFLNPKTSSWELLITTKSFISKTISWNDRLLTVIYNR